MAKKGQTFQPYTEEFKRKAVMMYVNGGKGYHVLEDKLRIKSPTQLKDWVKKHKQGEPLADQRWENQENSPPFIAFLKQHLKAQG